MKVAYQGIPGSFSYSAAQQAFGSCQEFLGTREFREIFALVSTEKADVGIVPLENSIAGSVYENYDLMARYDLHITRELYVKIEHHLLVAKGTEGELSSIRQVFSHAKALEQCSAFLERHPHIERIAISDTGTAAMRVARQVQSGAAAIASQEAGQLYGLSVLAANIENVSNNITRFVVLERSPGVVTVQQKCSIIFALPHRAGSLLALLTLVSGSQANLTKIESRPIATKPFEYLFYLDFEISTNPSPLFDAIKAQTTFLKVLGVYPGVPRQ